MSDLERNLRDLLADRAGTTAPPPGDWQDLTIRMARRNRRAKRLMAGALALVLVAGPLAGFAVARAVDDPEPAGRVTAGGPADASSADVRAAAGTARLEASWVYGGGIPLEKLFRRTAGSITIRAFISGFGTGNMCQGDGWCPPTDCFPDGMVVGQLNTEDAVGLGNGEHYAGVTGALKVTGGGYFGANGEGSPARWVTAQTSGAVAKVRVTFEGGGSDEMAPVRGIVLLAAPTDTAKLGGTVEALDGSGSVLAEADANSLPGGFVVGESRAAVSIGGGSSEAVTTTTMAPNASVPPEAPDASVSSGSAGSSAVFPGLRPECEPPPPTLPAPGEQPDDPAAAKAEVEQAFATAYAGGLDDDEAKGAAVEDSDELADTMAAASSGTFADQVKGASAVVTEVVFTSPTEAAVRYDINVKDYTNFPGRIGKALLIDGRWKVARVTVCADISLAGVNCPTK